MPKYVSHELEHERRLLVELKKIIDGRLAQVDQALQDAATPAGSALPPFSLTPTSSDYSDISIIEAMRRELSVNGGPMSNPALALALLEKGVRTKSPDRRAFANNINTLGGQRSDLFVRVDQKWDLVERHQRTSATKERRKSG